MLRENDLDSQLDLAPDDLPALCLEETWFLEHTFLDQPGFAKLQGLTRLELVEHQSIHSYEAMEAIGALPLQELVLLNCHRLEFDMAGLLFRPNFLTGLRKLHIEDPAALSYQPKPSALFPERWQEQLREMGDSLFERLRELRQLSGWCDLFAFGMRQGLAGWKKTSCPEGFMVTYKGDHRCDVDWMKVWTKPDSI